MTELLIFGLLCLATPILAYIKDGPLLDMVLTVTVGEPTLVSVNLSAHDPCNEITHHKDCNWPYMEVWLKAAPMDPPGTKKYWMPYCSVAGCLTTNITNFNFTLPPRSLPDGGPYKLSYNLFNTAHDPRKPIDYYSPSESMYDQPEFNIKGNNNSDPSAQWTPYDKAAHWWTGLGNPEGWLRNVSCASVGCARQCAQRILGSLLPEKPNSNANMTACLKACSGYGWNPYACTRENVMLPPTSTGGGSATSPTPTVPASTGSKIARSSYRMVLTTLMVLHAS
ncbi:hypothetical protein PG994_014734 [Apiospora phragmitis]|uniref:Uncharacterized protein n=1 Tax=Apiospora phragmitis TaxID=2905665 RepID=A0ABR1SUG1_9PEZI